MTTVPTRALEHGAEGDQARTPAVALLVPHRRWLERDDLLRAFVEAVTCAAPGYRAVQLACPDASGVLAVSL